MLYYYIILYYGQNRDPHRCVNLVNFVNSVNLQRYHISF